ncbi:MAG: RidA family protein [SAR324 cluster bacterium]|nr:RidA family protein [SAR324 cluster bacterium]MCZ6531398.1 RidA family protein [SAR324 cluster bacterium]MCZ6628679.1 RidA family protein [SAR324 cluster bacterium]MCZ6730421.1 RidA family protein [SAR324 cluster bacterium]
MSIEQRLQELGIELPSMPSPAGNYVQYVRTGNLIYLSGSGPLNVDGQRPTGKVGGEVSVEDAYQHARSIGLVQIARLKEALGELDKVNRIVKVLGMVNGVPGFGEQPKVINGFSDLMVEVFGDKGRHARSAVGMGSLPFGITVEIEAIVEVAD